MTTSSVVGELAAEIVLGGAGTKSTPFSPDRFV
jgi:hypothetical protein